MSKLQTNKKPKTIIRRTREDREKTGFTMFYPRIITDKSLSKTARLLLLYALTKPDDWVFKATNIAKELLGNDDRKSISKAHVELVRKGYAFGRFSMPPVIYLEKSYYDMDKEEKRQIHNLIREHEQIAKRSGGISPAKRGDDTR